MKAGEVLGDVFIKLGLAVFLFLSCYLVHFVPIEPDTMLRIKFSGHSFQLL